jgi:hypothetical protein
LCHFSSSLFFLGDLGGGLFFLSSVGSGLFLFSGTRGALGSCCGGDGEEDA